MARYEKCPSIKSIASLKVRAYKATKTIPWKRKKAYRAANHALLAAARAERLVRDAAKTDDAVLSKMTCTWASWAYKDAKAALAIAHPTGRGLAGDQSGAKLYYRKVGSHAYYYPKGASTFWTNGEWGVGVEHGFTFRKRADAQRWAKATGQVVYKYNLYEDQ